MKISSSNRGITFAELFTGKMAYVTVFIFALAAVAGLVLLFSTISSVSTLNQTLDQTSAQKVKIKGTQVQALVNLPSSFDVTDSDDIARVTVPALTAGKMLVGIVGSNLASDGAKAYSGGVDYTNGSDIFSPEDKGVATRILFSTNDLGDLNGYNYIGTGTVAGKTTHIYKSAVPQ